MSMQDPAAARETIVKNRDRFKRFIANNKAVIPAGSEGVGDVRTTCELMDERVKQLTAASTAAR